MKHLLPILAVTLILLNSCSSARKSAQTPDDLYYSPGSSRAAVAASGNDDGYYSPSASRQGQGDYYSTAPSDNYVRLKAQDPDRWSYFDDYSGYDSYYAPSAISPYYSMGMGYGYPFYGYGFGFGSTIGLGFADPYMAWNSYYLWNSYYNPYFYNPCYGGGFIAGNTKGSANAVYSRVRAFNGASYREGLATRTSNTNIRTYRPATTSSDRGFRNGNSRQFITTDRNGNSSRNGNSYYYRPANASNTNSPTRSYSPPSQPVRSYTPSSSGGGGGGGGFRPSRH